MNTATNENLILSFGEEDTAASVALNCKAYRMTPLKRIIFNPVAISVAIFFGSLIYYGNAALNFPTLFNVDNHVNLAATRYLLEHHRIPVVQAGESGIVFTEMGTTRSLRPPFTFIVSALTAKVAGRFIDDPIAKMRLGSPLIAAVTLVVVFVGFYMAFSRLDAAILGVMVIGLMPKFVFLASCNNDDIGAILSVSLLFTVTLALVKYGGRNSILVALAISFGLLLQTKYTAWLTLPWLGAYCLIRLRSVWPRLLKLSPLLLITVLLSGGWWVVFNMVHYGATDPSALSHAAKVQGVMAPEIEANRQGYLYEGVGTFDLLSNHDQFLIKSYTSLIGYLEWIELDIGMGNYLLYGGIFLVGLVGVIFIRRSQQEPEFHILLIVLLIAGQCIFYLHHNLVRDIQPQARYILPVIMPMVYLFIRALASVPDSVMRFNFYGRDFGAQAILITGLMLTTVAIHANTMNRYIKPSYIAKPFFTNISNPEQHSLAQAFDIAGASSINYHFTGEHLELERAGSGTASLLLGDDFCKLLPVNAIVDIGVSSQVNGGLHIRLDHSGQNSFDDIYWQPVVRGQSTLRFALNANHCTGAKISLDNRTHILTINSLRISELRVHEHGRPI